MRLKLSDRPDGVTKVFYLWNILGLWFDEKPKIYYLYSFVLHFFITYFYSFSMFLGTFSETNLTNTIESVYQSMSDLALLVKVIVILLQQHSYRELYKILYSELEMINESDLFEKKLIQRGQKRSNRLLYAMLINYYLSVTFLILKTIFSNEQELLFKVVYPFEWQGTTFIYYLVFIYQTIGIILQVTISAGVDSFPSSVMILLCEYCEAMSYNMNTLGISIYSNTDEKRYEMLKRILRNYIILNRTLKRLANGFSAIIIAQFCISAIVVCTTAFQISIASFSDEKTEFIFKVVYMISMLLQIFIPCYYGNRLYLASMSLTNSLFNSNWTQFDQKFKKNVILFMEFLKKPLTLKGGGIIELKLSAFLSTINFAYSIYNLLHRIQYKHA